MTPAQQERYAAACEAAGRILATALHDLSEDPATAPVPGGPSEPGITAASQRPREQAAGNPAA